MCHFANLQKGVIYFMRIFNLLTKNLYQNSNENETPYEQLKKMIIQPPPINLEEDEVCFYQGIAQATSKKTITTGYKGTSGGVSMRISKKFSIHIGNGNKKAVRETIAEKYPGKLYITNKRIILLAEKHGFNVNIPDIIQLEQFKDGYCIYQTSKNNLFLTKDIGNIAHLFDLINTAQQ